MSDQFSSVRPGDVISSDLMNFLLAKLSEIDQRVATLETGGFSVPQVTITSFDPPIQISAGQELTVNGTNFEFPAQNNNVSIDATRITEFRPGSTSIRLKFIVPKTLSIPSGGKNVTVRVQNAAGEYSSLYKILPAVSAPGEPPAIDSVLPVVGSLIFVNAAAIISGQHFADNPQENVIRFRLTVADGTEVIYPREGETIQIDAANSGSNQIELTIPDIDEIPAGQSRNVNLEVGVGAHVPDVVTINIRRSAGG
jgi:hypothetical protein